MEHTLQPYGHNAWLINFRTNGFSKRLCLNILKLAQMFQKQTDHWQEIVPAYDTLLIKPRPDILRQTAHEKITQALAEFAPDTTVPKPQKIIEIPVSYGGDMGPDLNHVAEWCGLTPKDIIARHSERDYLVCLMGFIPGFAFMSETDSALHIPRRETPRANVHKGSVGLAGWQTGVYGLSSPGGWQIIGRTPLSLFDPKRASPFLLAAGDWIRFVPKTS